MLEGHTGHVAEVSIPIRVALLLVKQNIRSLSPEFADVVPLMQQSYLLVKVAPNISSVLHIRYRESDKSLTFCSAAANFVDTPEADDNAFTEI